MSADDVGLIETGVRGGRPGLDVVKRLAVALEANLADTEELMRAASWLGPQEHLLSSNRPTTSEVIAADPLLDQEAKELSFASIMSSYILGGAIRTATIVADEGTSGHVSFSKTRTMTRKIEEADYGCAFGQFIATDVRRWVEMKVMVLLAGGMTLEQWLGIDPHEVGSGLVRLFTEEADLVAAEFGESADNRGSMIVGGDLALPMVSSGKCRVAMRRPMHISSG